MESGRLYVKDFRSLRYFFQPEGVAVVGASNNSSKGGSHIIRNMLRWYPGPVYPINPRDKTIFDRPAYRSVLDTPGRVDLAMLLIPAPSIPAVLRECGQKGVKAVLIESSGFAEAGPNGQRLNAEALAIADEYGMRIWGPNCTGLVDAVSGVVSPFGYMDAIRQGRVSFVSQSGMLSGVLTSYIVTTNMFGVCKCCAIGNKADLNESDFLEYLGEDPGTEIITMYLESLVDGRRFIDAAARISRQKPLLLLKSGRTSQGARASQSHTAGLAVDDRVAEGAFQQCGIVRVDDLMELLELTKAFAMQPFQNAGDRVAVVTTTGGAGVMAADELARRGLIVPRLSERSLARLREVYPDWVEPDNPVDFWTTAEQIGTDRALQHCLQVALEDDDIDMVLLMIVVGPLVASFDFAGFSNLVGRYQKPVVLWGVGEPQFHGPWKQEIEQGGIPCFWNISTAANALKAMRDFAVWHRTGQPGRFAPLQPAAPPDGIEPLFARAAGERRTALNEAEAKQVLRGYGVPVTAELLATTEDAAAAAAAQLGYPVALKIASSEIAHKSDAGGVRLSLTDEAQVRAAYRDILQAVERRFPDARRDGVLVQEMLHGGTEVIIGMTRDPQFGPVIMFGLGGIFVEVLEDVAFRLAPLSEADADALIRQVKGFRLLQGVRGNPPADLAAIKQALLAVSRLAVDCPQIAQIDVNPLIVFPAGKGAKAADALVMLDRPR